MRRGIRFWITGHRGLSDGELLIRWRRWWHQHWWPSRIRQLDQERRYWKSKVDDSPLVNLNWEAALAVDPYYEFPDQLSHIKAIAIALGITEDTRK